MRAVLKDCLLVLIAEGDDEAASLAAWKQAHGGHVLRVRETESPGIELDDLGPAPEACREPINVVSTSPDPAIRLIGNFAESPFGLDGMTYRSVESFWQSLKFTEESERRRIAGLSGHEARHAGQPRGYGATIDYCGLTITVGTFDHWHLMERACRAKFEENADARAALLATGTRPLTHVVRRDSRAIPGAIMADIWMRLRRNLGAP